MSVLIFLAVLFVLVLVHELGHFAVAKWTGMRVDEFGIGFPPKLFGIKRGETVYSFNALPIGGFVKIFGEDGEGAPSARLDADFSEQGEGKSPSSGQSRYGKGGSAGSFSSKSKWAQSAVLVAGISMNILFAWLLIAIAFSIGVASTVSEADATENAKLTITSVLPGGPAALAEIPSGSVIKGAIAGDEVLASLTPSAFIAFIGEYPDESVQLVYTYKNEPRIAMLNPTTNIIAGAPDQAAIGIALAQIEVIERGPVEVVKDSFIYTVTAIRDITVGIGSLFYDAIQFKADFSQVAGPIGIVGLVGEASAFGITALLMFTAFISLNLAVINILPFPALDGGRLLFVIIETVKGSPIPVRYASTLNAIGFIALLVLMVVVSWNDILRLI